MNFLQWNITSFKTNFTELKLLLKNYTPVCVCLQETRHGDSKLYPPSRYNIMQSPRKREDDHERGVALLIRPDVNFKNVPLNTNLQAVAARVWLDKWYTVCSLYLPHISLETADMINLIEQLPRPFVLMGDMNARHHLWGEPIDNDRGRVFEQLINNFEISLINSDSPTHFHIQTDSYTKIDLTFCSDDCVTDFDHSVTDSLCGSDHYPIIIAKPHPPEIGEPSYKFKTEKADWTKFRTLTNNFIPPNTDNIDELMDALNSFIIEAATNSIPISKGKCNRIPVPWWNAACQEATAQKKRDERAMKRNPTTANKIAYKRSRALSRKILNQARRESWMNYVSSININTSMNKIWKRIKKMKGKFSRNPPPLLQTVGDNLTQDPQITSNIFAETFSAISNTSNYTSDFNRYRSQKERRTINFTTSTIENYNTPLSMAELSSALQSTKETSPGQDKITFSMLKNCHSSLKAYILQLFNNVFNSITFPTSWKTAIVIPIPKANKDTTIPLNYRPISLINCSCKLFEKMINVRLMWYLETNELLNPNQAGFRKNRSTTDPIVQLVCDIENAIARRDHTIAVFFDLEKAYDMAWRYGIIAKLFEYGLRGNLPKLLQEYLSQRKIKVKINNTLSNSMHVEEGVPQGSVLSCTLFAIAIDGCLTSLPHGVHASLYVDDLTIYSSASSTILAERQLQLAIYKLQKWCKETGFKFSEQKTVAMHICRVRRCPKTAHQLTLNNQPISYKDKHKYLGIVMDSSLTWTEHIKQLRQDCGQKMKLLKHLSYTTWGADSKTLIRLYQTLIKPKLEYGREAYGSASASQLKKLDPIQNLALRTATGAFRTSPISSLEVLSGTKSLSFQRDFNLLNYLMRVVVNPTNPINEYINENNILEEPDIEQSSNLHERSFLLRLRNTVQKYNLNFRNLMSEKTTFPPWERRNIVVCPSMIQHCKSDVSELTLKHMFLCHLEEHATNELHVYTDGSKSDEGVAYATINSETTIKRKIDPASSIYTAELHGIMEAINLSPTYANNKITIFTDSKSSIQGIAKLRNRNPLIQEIADKAEQSPKQFILCWVPSHVGVPGNERADQAAREALSLESITPHRLVRSDVKASIKRKIKENWKIAWASNENNKLRAIAPDLTPLPNSSCRNRHWERTLLRLRIGHTRLTHGYLMVRGEQPTCEWCGMDTPLTIDHLLANCPNLDTKRRQFFGRPRPSLAEILIKGDTSYEGTVYKFLKSAEILNSL